jgi:hypothetical protein
MATATQNGTSTEKADAAEAWVEMFAAGWAHPVDADSFCDHFDPWLDDEVRTIQPSLRPVVGKRAPRGIRPTAVRARTGPAWHSGKLVSDP